MAAGLLELCNGKIVVVFLFVPRVLLSIPQSLLYEAIALCMLAIVGLAVEISAENSPAAINRFKMRTDASSGILLGTVTLPTVMLVSHTVISNNQMNEKDSVKKISTDHGST